MTIREAIRAASARLEQAGVDTPLHDASEMLAHLLGENTLMMRMNGHRELAQEKQAQFDAFTARRAAREPMQYILGTTAFMGQEFHVEPGVLCPRPDTEILCEEALRHVRPDSRVLDIGTGSGALAVSIAKLGVCSVTAVDVSDTALRVAKGNAEANGAQVRFVKSDCFSALAGETFDVIVSNPPYIRTAVIEELKEEVKCHDPFIALDGKEDGLHFYRRITEEAPEYLKSGGKLFFEIGHDQGDDVKKLLEQAGFTGVTVKKDLAGLDRVVFGSYNILG